MSKTYEALKRIEAGKKIREAGTETQESDLEESSSSFGRSPESGPDSGDTYLGTNGDSVATLLPLDAEGQEGTQEIGRSAERVSESPAPDQQNEHNEPALAFSADLEEQYERLYTQLIVQPQTATPVQTIMIVGAHHGDGVTTSTSLFAQALAQSRRVLLIDANLRTPALAAKFHLRDNGGFADFIARKISLDGAITQTEIPNLSVMTSGSTPLAPPYLYENGSFDELLDDLRKKFDFIIFDTAPLGWHLDSIFLASRVDGVILLIKAESTYVKLGQDIKKKLDEVDARILGVIVNRTQDYVPRFLRRLLS